MPNYSLWLEPTTSTYAPCAKFILDVAHRHPEAPYFPPHVTLVGAFHASDDRRATSIFSSAARALSSVDGGRRGPRIGLERVECGERRHQCVYIRLVKTEAWRDHFARALEATSGRAATSAGSNGRPSESWRWTPRHPAGGHRPLPTASRRPPRSPPSATSGRPGGTRTARGGAGTCRRLSIQRRPRRSSSPSRP